MPANATAKRELYSVNSAALALDFSCTKLYEWMRAGTLKYIEVDGMRRIPASEISRLASEGLPKSV